MNHAVRRPTARLQRSDTKTRLKPAKSSQNAAAAAAAEAEAAAISDGYDDGLSGTVKQLPTLWVIYYNVLTCWIPGCVLSVFGIKGLNPQKAWREKIGLISIILGVAGLIAFLTFGFQRALCPNQPLKFSSTALDETYLVIHGRVYDMATSEHPRAFNVPTDANILYPPVDASGKDASFLFQKVNGYCRDLITPSINSTILNNGIDLAWYFPCKLRDMDGVVVEYDFTEPYRGYACHTTDEARENFLELKTSGDITYTWEEIKSRNLVAYSGSVIDLDLLQYIDSDNLEYPEWFDEIATGEENPRVRGTDMTIYALNRDKRHQMACLLEIVKVGTVDAEEMGCLAAKVVLYLSLAFILFIVFIKFILALFFAWVMAPRMSAHRRPTGMDPKARNEAIERWADDLYQSAHITMSNDSRYFLTSPSMLNRSRTSISRGSISPSNARGIPTSSCGNKMSISSLSLNTMVSTQNLLSSWQTAANSQQAMTPSSSRLVRPKSSYSQCPSPYTMERPLSGLDGDRFFVSPLAVPQPDLDYEPFNFPLAHLVCMVTAYSESELGLRTTFDSITTTEYPNSHKIILVVCDGLVQGEDNTLTTPELVIKMMTEFVSPPDECEPHSYVAIANGNKRHNRAKVIAGFYKYDDSTVPVDQQQRVPLVCIVKSGNPEEVESGAAKTGNRGKRDSQVILMNYFQKLIFNERMTPLEHALLDGMRAVTGLFPDMYELLLMVDADTKVFPDSLTYLVATLVRDPELMGICGETKIANKAETWVTAIQVFEYYISHHMSKAFESIFGGVTCLPGCFSMYRIKSPKGKTGHWVPILANPDIIEHYGENIVDTLHEKNLLLLGEDRYLTTLMLRAFPKRKQVFVPQAVAKTQVPTQFSVLLSQRRRWINSTVHNLLELVLVRDLCGTFCFSMQFVVFVELVGTVVLPAAISFTLYVIVIAIVSKPTPTLTLILLAIILGLPSVLIVCTAKRVSYVMWMLIYLLALPIWNFVLPAYAYWHFDDFSWGATRKVTGEKGKGAHGDKEGEFDSSLIEMKSWQEFDRENYWNALLMTSSSPRSSLSEMIDTAR